ncbi:hypothetical protein BSL78_05816 [Apostichopus japonicus]|uniref:Uncharacterized protein n=1 Tax=Stichopus japonicus TaxID=307972 RepID=A0A2G8LAF2_STIJA|nr:hypothetical protein BSL78_05816 [Apostichopus japonicus]
MAHSSAPHVYYMQTYASAVRYGTSPGGYLAAVDTLPKARDLVQEMKFFQVPACAELDENEYCGLSAKEMWHPLHLRLEQICDQPSLTITFDLPPVEIGVDKFTVYLYQEDQREELDCSYSNEVGKIKYRFNEITDTFEECLFNQTFNLTFFNQSEGLNYNASYMIITKIQDRDKDRYYYPTPICSPTILIKPPPCDSNPCDINEICIPDCLNFTCQVIVEEEDDDTEELQYNWNLIWITSGVSGLVLAIIFILLLVFRCYAIKAGANHMTECNKISTVRLICNSNTHLQEFAFKLSINLETLVGCPVEVLTLTDPSDLQSLESDAVDPGKNCFIMDNGLSILHFKEPYNGEITDDIVRTAVEKLPEASVDSTILIQFDFGDMFNPCYQEYTTYKLPSEWKQFVKELNPAADLTLVGDEDALLPSYQSIRNVIQENLCYKSVKKWMLSSEYDHEESVASVCNFSTVTSLDDEEVNGVVTSYHTVI